jgi:2-haloacid dehalogenase
MPSVSQSRLAVGPPRSNPGDERFACRRHRGPRQAMTYDVPTCVRSRFVDMANRRLADVRALIFDVFGTLVDWRTSIAREARDILSPLGIAIDWDAFADQWRAQYQPAMEDVRSGRLPFSKLDALHRRNLDIVLSEAGLGRVDEGTRVNLNLAWHRLDAWPDVRPGLSRLRAKFLVAPCSNGNISLMVNLARRNELLWDAILGAELARDYKPKPEVYLTAAAAFDCKPGETMMVAAHSSDLAAAAAIGLRTAFIARPDEHGRGLGERAATVLVDVSAANLMDLADALHCPTFPES